MDVIRGLLLDFDGLICDTERAAHQSWRELYAGVGQEFAPYLWAAMAGRRDGEAVAVADLAERLGRPVGADALAWRRNRKQVLCDAEPLRPGVAALTDLARDRGLILGVVSNSPLRWVSGHLLRLRVWDRFSVVVTGERAVWPKPAPDLYERALEQAGLAANEAVAVEDSVTGVAAAKAAGLRCIAVPNAVGRAADLADAAVVLDTLAGGELPAALNRLERLGREGALVR